MFVNFWCFDILINIKFLGKILITDLLLRQNTEIMKLKLFTVIKDLCQAITNVYATVN